MIADLRFGLRMALRSPAWAAAIIVSMAIGIGATVAIASAVQALLLYQIPAPQREQLVEFDNRLGTNGMEQNLADFRRLREGARPFAELAAFTTPYGFNLGDERAWGQFVTDNYFSTIGLQPLAGRLIGEGENGPVVVLAEAFWRRRFHGNLQIVGQTMRMNGRPVTIIGIAPDAFRGVRAGFLASLWLPLTAGTYVMPNSFPKEEDGTGVSVFARLRPGTSMAQGQAALDVLTKRLDKDFPIPKFWANQGERKISLEPSGQFLSNFRSVAEGLLQLLGAMSVFVLLIACGNVTNLQLARAAGRDREMATRRALGATRGRLVVQMTTESMALGVVGGAGGLLLASWLLAMLGSFRLPELPVVLDLSIRIDWRVAAFTALLTMAATLLSGVVAAWKGTGARPERHWLRDGLVVTQIALTVVLAVATGLLSRSLGNARHLDAGFRPGQTLLAQFDPLNEGYAPKQIEALVREMLETPGTAVTDSVPLTIGGWGADLGLEKDGFVSLYSVTRGFFDALGMRIVEGRDFAATGDKGRVLINQELARRLFPKRSPIGQRIGKKREYEVIGVVRNHARFFLGEDPEPMMYQTLFQEEPRAALTLATRGGQLPKARITFFNVRTGNDQLEAALFVPRATAALVTVFGGMGLLLTAIGLYALMAYTVGRRMRELGIRIALGARPVDVAKTVFRRTVVLAGSGTALGVVMAYWTAELLEVFLYGLSPRDPASYATAVLGFALVAAIASWIPSRRAISNEPIEALRQE